MIPLLGLSLVGRHARAEWSLPTIRDEGVVRQWLDSDLLVCDAGKPRWNYGVDASWAKMIKNPEDRRAAAKEYIESVGGKLHGFCRDRPRRLANFFL